MNREFVEKWVHELRTTSYEQHQFGFSTPVARFDEDPEEMKYEGFCCLGLANYIGSGDPADTHVLCHNTPELHTIEIGDTGTELIGGRSLWSHLVAMNDGIGIYESSPRSFSQIADFIEEKLLKEEN
jgi:hypothetical protein